MIPSTIFLLMHGLSVRLKRNCMRVTISAEFLQDRRLDGSFVPPPEIRELRHLMRFRLSLQQQRNEVHNQIRDLFETANLKLSSVVSDLMGLSGRRIIEAMIAGEDSPELLSWKVRGRLRKKEKEVRESLKGCFQGFHRMLLKQQYQHYQFLTQQIADIEQEVARRMEPYAEKIAALTTIPGVDRITSWYLIAELGVDMSVFPDAAHCASWAGVSPGSCESAGKSFSGRTKKGNKYLRQSLTQAAWAASRCKQGYLRTFFYRTKARRGWARATFAVAHKILVIAYSILKNGGMYQDLGSDYFDRLHPERTTRHLVERLQRLGLIVTVTPSNTLTPRFNES
jgi:transposase